MNKYHAKKTLLDNILFDSKREASRYQELKLMQRAGAIQNLKLQPKYPLIVEGVKICDYKADFYYETKQGQKITEDCKGVKTRIYVMKRKLMQAIYGIEILET